VGDELSGFGYCRPRLTAEMIHGRFAESMLSSFAMVGSAIFTELMLQSKHFSKISHYRRMHSQGNIHELCRASDKRNKRSFGRLQVPRRLADSDTRSAFRGLFGLRDVTSRR
jgi:hypothetical protein